MSDPLRTDDSRALDPEHGVDQGERDAKIEQLLLTGLDNYFAGQYDQAINAFKEMSLRKDGPLPVDGILMQLGRAYLDAGKRVEAQQTFNRLVEEFPDSPFSSDARRELDNLKKT